MILRASWPMLLHGACWLVPATLACTTRDLRPQQRYEGAASMSTDPSPNAATPAPPGRSFEERLRGDPRLRTFAVEYAYTPPVPVEHGAPGEVVVFAYTTTRNIPISFRVSPPTHRVVADYPSARVRTVASLDPHTVGLTIDSEGYVGEVPITRHTYDDLVAADEAYARAEGAVLQAFFTRGAPDPQACRTLTKFLPDRASPPLLPALRRASPTFFSALDRCAAG